MGEKQEAVAFNCCLSSPKTNMQLNWWRDLLQAIHLHISGQPKRRCCGLWPWRSMIFNRRIIYKYFSDSLGLFAANSEWPRIRLSCPGIVSFCQAFRTSASCQLEQITKSHVAWRNCRRHVYKKDAQRNMHVLCQVMLVCKTHVLKRYLIPWLSVLKVRFKELDSSLEFPAKAFPLSQFQIILLRSQSMPRL